MSLRDAMSLREAPGAAVSGAAHLALLAAMLWSFSGAASVEDAQEAIPIETLTASQFNEIMKGEKTGKLSQTPRLRAEKRAEASEPRPVSALAPGKIDVPTPPPRGKPAEDPGHAEETKPAPTPPAPTPPERPVETAKLEAKPEPKAEAKPEPVNPDAEALDKKPVPKPKVEAKKPVEPPKKPEPKFKPDEVAKLLAEKKPDEPKPDQKPAPKPRSGEADADPSQKFDVGAISRLLNKDAPQRKAATGRDLAQTASLGAPNASAARMAPSLWAQLDGLLQDQYRHCWTFVGLAGQEKYVPQIRVQLAQDGSLVGQPELLNPPPDPNLRSLAESALRATRRCNPLRIPAQFQPYYEQWKGRIVRFDPEDML